MADRQAPPGLALDDLADTQRLAASVAANAPEGAVLVLSGPLGAGKTTFTQFLAAALGSTAAVSSPSYTLVHEYPAPGGPLIHIDAYRMAGLAQLEALGFDDYRERARLVVVEWGEALLDDDPDAMWLELAFDDRQPHAAKPEDPGSVPRVARWRRTPPGDLGSLAEGSDVE